MKQAGLPTFMQWPHNLKFKAAGRAPVKGGRWAIRREPIRWESSARPWKAWTFGKAQRWSKRFATFQEAMDWARYVADMYALADEVGGVEQVDLLIRQKTKRDRDLKKMRADAEEARAKGISLCARCGHLLADHRFEYDDQLDSGPYTPPSLWIECSGCDSTEHEFIGD